MQKTGGPGGIGAELAWLIAGFVLLHGAMAGFRMAAPLFILRQGQGELAAGVLVALCSLAPVFVSLPAARMADRRGIRVAAAWLVAASIVGGLLAAAWPVYPMLALGALLTGASAGAVTVLVQQHAGRLAHSPTQLKQVFAWTSLAPGASNFLGPVAAGLLIDHAGWRSAFLLAVLFPLLSWIGLRQARDFPPEQAPAGEAGRRTAWDLWREPAFRRLMLMNWFMSACWDLHGFLVPVLGHERGLSASAIGSILGAFGIAMALVRLVLPLVAHRLREWKLIVGANAATGLTFAIYPFMTSGTAMALCSALAGAALGLVQPMVMSLLHQVTPPHRRGDAVAMRVMMIKGSSVALPLLFGLGGTLVGVSSVFWLMGGGVACASWLGVALRRVGDQGAAPGPGP